MTAFDLFLYVVAFIGGGGVGLAVCIAAVAGGLWLFDKVLKL